MKEGWYFFVVFVGFICDVWDKWGWYDIVLFVCVCNVDFWFFEIVICICIVEYLLLFVFVFSVLGERVGFFVLYILVFWELDEGG